MAPPLITATDAPVRGSIALALRRAFATLLSDLRSRSAPLDPVMKFVIGYKLVGGFLLLVVAAGLFGFSGDAGFREDLRTVLVESNLGSDNRFLRSIANAVGLLTERGAFSFALVALFYAAVELTEGCGLALRKRWAEYLTAIATSLFIPVEVMELVNHLTPIKFLTLLVNVGVVVYLVWSKKLFRGPASE
jgi:uncharacterized membrane protein (DUF2068 family)